MGDKVEHLIGALLVFLALFAVPLFVTVLTVLWINPVTVLEKLVMLGVGAVVFGVSFCIDLIIIAIFSD